MKAKMTRHQYPYATHSVACNEPRFRELTVLRVERISAGFQRIVLPWRRGADGFPTSLGLLPFTRKFFPEPKRLYASDSH